MFEKKGGIIVFIIIILIAVLGILFIISSDAFNGGVTGNSILDMKETNDVFTINTDVKDQLNSLYDSTKTEFSACVDVEPIFTYNEDKTKLKTTFSIIGISEIVESEGENYVKHKYCKYGLIHSHPRKNCYFSLTDIFSIKERYVNGEMFSLVICDKDNIIYVSRNNMIEEKIKI